VLDEQEVFLHIAQLQEELRAAVTRAACAQGESPDRNDEAGP